MVEIEGGYEPDNLGDTPAETPPQELQLSTGFELSPPPVAGLARFTKPLTKEALSMVSANLSVARRRAAVRRLRRDLPYADSEQLNRIMR